MNRRDWLKNSILTASLAGAGIENSPPAILEGSEAAANQELEKAQIYKLLGFATMTGEDPVRLWARLQATREWLAGPLSPDSWCGQVFIADHADIFAFRFLSLPPAWIKDHGEGNRAVYYGQQFPIWLPNGRAGGAPLVRKRPMTAMRA